MKTKEELNALKKEVETESKEPRKLTEEELAQVSGGAAGSVKFFNEDKGFGIIKPEDGCRDSFVQAKDIKVKENPVKVNEYEAFKRAHYEN